jgi:hypothetical protein
MTAHHADIAKPLVEDPDRYGELRHRFAPELEYYRQVRNVGPQTLATLRSSSGYTKSSSNSCAVTRSNHESNRTSLEASKT